MPARYFGPTALKFQSEFVRCLKTDARKDWNTMYGFVSIDSYTNDGAAVDRRDSSMILGSSYPTSFRIANRKSPDSTIYQNDVLLSDSIQDDSGLQVDVLSVVVGVDTDDEEGEGTNEGENENPGDDEDDDGGNPGGNEPQGGNESGGGNSGGNTGGGSNDDLPMGS